MKKLLMTIISIALLLLPLAVYAQSENSSKEAPPVSQALVPEGDFALKLATSLGLGTPSEEAQAEDMLTSVGIAPKNGWIADYPVTPNIIGELQNAVASAADSKKLPMGKDDALKAFQNLTTEFSLAVVPGGSGQYAENQPQPDSSMIDNYYYEEGPPVVTYYPPPWDYYYLYDWAPYPFWYGGFFFPGFFVLTDFSIVVHGHHHHHHLVTNHFINPRTHAVTRVDPVSHTQTSFSRTTAFNSTTTKNAASSIFNRSSNSMGSRTFGHSNSLTNGSGMDQRSSQSFGRSLSSPSSGSGSSCANCHGGNSSFRGGGGESSRGFSSSHSSGGFSGSHSFGGFSGGGFSGGHGSGGGRGR